MKNMTDEPATRPDPYAAARTVLSQIPCAVVLIGAADGQRRTCSTGTAMYVAFAPPRLAIALHPGSRTCRAIKSTGEFSVSVMQAWQHDIADRAGRSAAGDDKFVALGLPTRPAPDGMSAPALEGAVATMWCRVFDEREVGDHILFIGDVVDFDTDLEAAHPLLRHQRRYASLGGWLSDEEPGGYPT